jgi:RHS repeat-associated protein
MKATTTSTGYETGANNQLLSDGTFTYQYDAEGNRTTRTRISTDPADDYLTEYTWDHRNRLTSVTLKNNSDEVTGRVEYDYDVFNLMVARREYADNGSPPVKSQHFIYDGSQITLVFNNPDPSGSQPSALRSRLLRGPAVDQIFATEDALGEVIWPLADHLNTVRDFVDSSGNLLNHRQFDSFGNQTAESNPAATDFLFNFTGGYQDPLTGLIYRWHRWYDSKGGGWLSEDPKGLGPDTNARRYVTNRVTDSVDPHGLEGIEAGLNPFTWPGVRVVTYIVSGYYWYQYDNAVQEAKLDRQLRIVREQQFSMDSGNGSGRCDNYADITGQYRLGPAASQMIEDLAEFNYEVMALQATMATPGASSGLSTLSAPGKVTADARFAQKAYRAEFSKTGKEVLSKIAGRPIKTVEDLTAAIKCGAVKPSQIPVNYIMRDGRPVILNTRTAKALEAANIEKSKWFSIDRSNSSLYEKLLDDQLSRNELGSGGSATAILE